MSDVSGSLSSRLTTLKTSLQKMTLVDFLFADWDEEEWLLFDNYMIGNLQSYLNTGFVKSHSVNLETRKFMAETDYSFMSGLVIH